MRVRNFTGEDITIWSEDETRVVASLKSEGRVWIEEYAERRGEIGDIPIELRLGFQIHDCPHDREGTLLIVREAIARAVGNYKERGFAYPIKPVCDSWGNVVGYKALRQL
jgi:hypothetical protein